MMKKCFLIEMRSLLVLAYFTFFAGGCVSSDATVTPPPVLSQTSQPEGTSGLAGVSDSVLGFEDPTTLSPLAQQAHQVVLGVNDGNVALPEGLEAIHTLLMQVDHGLFSERADLDADSDTDTSNHTTAEPVLLPRPLVNYVNLDPVLTLADAAAELRRGNPVQNLAVILGVSAFSEDAPSITDVNQLFLALTERESVRHQAKLGKLISPQQAQTLEQLDQDGIPEHIDPFLIRFFTIHNQRISEEQGFFHLGKSALTYFSNRIDHRLIENLREVWTAIPLQHQGNYANRSCDLQVPVRGRAEAFNFEVLKSRYLKEYEIPLEIQRASGELLTEYAGLGLLTSLLSPDLDRWFLEHFHFLIHTAYFAEAQNQVTQAGADASEIIPVLGGPARHLAYKYLRIWMTTSGAKPKLTTRQIKRLIHNISGQIEQARARQQGSLPFGARFFPVQSQIDQINSLFDRNPEQFSLDRISTCAPGRKIKRWGELMDEQYWKALAPYRDWLLSSPVGKGTQASQDLFAHEFNLPEHPLTRVYFNRAMIALNWAYPVATLKAQAISADKMVKTAKERGASFLSAAQHLAGMPEDLPNLPIESAAIMKYVKGYYQVEALRYFLEEDIARSKSMDLSKSKQAQGGQAQLDQRSFGRARMQVYELLRANLKSALSIRFAARISLRAANAPIWIDPEIGQEKIEKQGSTFYEFVYQNMAVPLQVQPGIYNVEGSGIDIYARSIQFHPLAMIDGRGTNAVSLLRASGKRVRIFTVEPLLSDAWIDVSSSDANGNTDQTLPPILVGTVPVRSSHVCRLVERKGSDHLADVVIFPWETHRYCINVNREGRSDEDENSCRHSLNYADYSYREDEWVKCDLYDDEHPGLPPGDPPQATSGLQSGSIVFGGADQSQLGFPLLVAMGGDGRTGYDGAESSLCDRNHEYQWASDQDPFLFNVRGGGRNERYDCIRFEDHGNNCPDALWPAGMQPLPYRRKPRFDVPKGRNGFGGEATNGGDILAGIDPQIHLETYLMEPGQPGADGQLAACGPAPEARVLSAHPRVSPGRLRRETQVPPLASLTN